RAWGALGGRPRGGGPPAGPARLWYLAGGGKARRPTAAEVRATAMPKLHRHAPGPPMRRTVALSGRREQREPRSAEAPCSTASIASALHVGARRETPSGIGSDHGLLDHVVCRLEER